MNRKKILLKLRTLSFWCVGLVFCAAQPADDFLQILQQKYDAYQEKYPSVKINLVINQPIFSPGDTAFFSVWYVNEELMAVNGESILNLDLIAGNGSTAQKIRFKIQNGKGYNQLVFQKDLEPGDYTLVSYSDWMKNFGESWFYKKSIQLVAKKQIAPRKKVDESVGFFPEGGNLVEGVVNKVMVTGSRYTELTIRDAAKTEIVKVALDSLGLGSFKITPQSNQKYTAELTAGKSWNLPEVTRDGVSVRFEQNDLSEILLSLPPGSTFLNKEIYAIVTSNGKIMIKRRLTIADDQAVHLQIPKHDKTDAYHQLYVFDASGQILAQRVFVPSQTQNVVVKMQLPAEVKQRDPINCAVEVLDAQGNGLETDLRVTIVQERLFKNHSLSSDFYLSDLPAVADRAEKLGKHHKASLNDFLITQKWQRINWADILKDKSTDILFPFKGQSKLKGYVISKTTSLPAPDSTVIISYLQNNNAGFEAYTKNGKFEVPFLFDFWGEDQVFCTLQYQGKNIDDSYDIFITRDTVKLSERWTSIEGQETSAYGEYALSKLLVSSSYSFFGSNQQRNTQREVGLNNSFEEEFLNADYSVNVADYVVFPKMEDLLREVIPFVQFRTRANVPTVRISFRYETSTRTYKEDPLYIIDGVMTKNTGIFVALKPENLVTIKVINNPNKLAQLSRLGENGIIFVETKKRDYSRSAINHNHFSVVGFSRPVEFTRINYAKSTIPSRLPDLRSTLEWNPTLTTDKTGRTDVNFYASDDIGPMKVLVQGLTKDGRPFEAEQEIKVAFKPLPK